MWVLVLMHKKYEYILAILYIDFVLVQVYNITIVKVDTIPRLNKSIFKGGILQ